MVNNFLSYFLGTETNNAVVDLLTLIILPIIDAGLRVNIGEQRNILDREPIVRIYRGLYSKIFLTASTNFCCRSKHSLG